MKRVFVFSLILSAVTTFDRDAVPAAGAAARSQAVAWDARAIIGFHQAGASSAESIQNLFFDFFVARPFSNEGVNRSRFGLWGQVRVASAPQQLNVPLSQFTAGFVNQIGEVPVNELAQSAEFLTGFEARPEWLGWPRANPIRTLSFVGFFGASGAFSDPTTEARVFRVPPATSPQWDNFVSYFPEFAAADVQSAAPFIGLVPPDRERFYRQYGLGIRYTHYGSASRSASPAMFTATIGQDQAVTRGRYTGSVLKFDAFYPLPLDLGAGTPRFVYFFGTANLAVARPEQRVPLGLELVSTPCLPSAPPEDAGVRCGVRLSQDNVAVFAIPSSRDTYRIGVGIDVLAFINGLKTPSPAGPGGSN